MSPAKSRLAAVVLAALGALAGAMGPVTHRVMAAKPGPEADQPKAADQRSAKSDQKVRPPSDGTPLPEGAIARLGSPEWRDFGSSRARLLFAPDSQTVII